LLTTTMPSSMPSSIKLPARSGGDKTMPDTLRGFWGERADFLTVMAIDNDEGGFDVTLRIDGRVYTDPASKDALVEGWTKRPTRHGLRREGPGPFPVTSQQER
jgi:hypothetical protein